MSNKSRAAEHPSAITFFQKPPQLDDYVQSANQIDLCGVTLTSTINYFLDQYEEMWNGAKPWTPPTNRHNEKAS